MNKAKGRQHTRQKARRERLRVTRASKQNAKKIDRARRIKEAKEDRAHGNRKYSPSDIRRNKSRASKQKAWNHIETR